MPWRCPAVAADRVDSRQLCRVEFQGPMGRENLIGSSTMDPVAFARSPLCPGLCRLLVLGRDGVCQPTEGRRAPAELGPGGRNG